jgi:hypothetical protein
MKWIMCRHKTPIEHEAKLNILTEQGDSNETREEV